MYILLRMGYSHEAEAYTGYIFQRIKEATARNGPLPIMFTIVSSSVRGLISILI